MAAVRNCTAPMHKTVFHPSTGQPVKVPIERIPRSGNEDYGMLESEEREGRDGQGGEREQKRGESKREGFGNPRTSRPSIHR